MSKVELKSRQLKDVKLITDRPEGMTFEEYKEIRKKQNKFLHKFVRRGVVEAPKYFHQIYQPK